MAPGRKSVEQMATLSRHDDDKKRVQDFVNTWRRKGKQQESIDTNSMCCCAVSTTLNSTLYLLGVGVESLFTGTLLYSEDIHNPWVITGYVEDLPELANSIRTQWDAMEVHGNRDRINLIAQYIVYDATDLEKPPQLIAHDCDIDDNVRARVDDITILSHPPRDIPLLKVLAEKDGEEGLKKYNQKMGKVKKFAQNWKELHDSLNEDIPHEKISKRLEEQREKARDAFNELYSTYYEQCKLATLQFEQRYPPNSGMKSTTFATLFTVALFLLYSAFFSSNSLRFSFIFSSILFFSFLFYYFKMYPHPDKQEKQLSSKKDIVKYDNEVHRPFPTAAIKPRDPKKAVFDQLVGQEFGMNFDDVMVSDN